jgi:hypothetical protein
MGDAETKIKVKELIQDLRAGLDDEALMNKYHISATQLKRLLQKLVDGGFIEQSELDARAEYFARKKAEAESEPFVSVDPDSDEQGDNRQANPKNSGFDAGPETKTGEPSAKVGRRKTGLVPIMSAFGGLLLALLYGYRLDIGLIMSWVAFSLVFFLVMSIVSRWLPASDDTWRLFQSLCLNVLICGMMFPYLATGLVVQAVLTVCCFVLLKYILPTRWKPLVWVTIGILIVINGAKKYEDIKGNRQADRIVQEMEIADPVFKLRNDLYRKCVKRCHDDYDLSFNPATWNPFSKHVEWCLEGCDKTRSTP